MSTRRKTGRIAAFKSANECCLVAPLAYYSTAAVSQSCLRGAISRHSLQRVWFLNEMCSYHACPGRCSIFCCIRSNFRHATPILIVRRYGCWMPRRLVFSRPYYRLCLCIIWICLSACCLSDPNVLMAQYLENSWTRYLATIANY